jgi:hypothetical protein
MPMPPLEPGREDMGKMPMPPLEPGREDMGKMPMPRFADLRISR